MKTLFKKITLFLAALCFSMAFYLGCQERKTATLSEYSEIFGDRDTGMIQPQALGVRPGISWAAWSLTDSTFALLSQDSRDTTQRIVREDSLLAWINTQISSSGVAGLSSDGTTITGTINTDWQGTVNNFEEGLRIGLTGAQILSGNNNPNGVITAPVGSLWLRRNGTARNTIYMKESGAGNTGWTAVDIYADTLRVSNDTLYITGQTQGFYIGGGAGGQITQIDSLAEIYTASWALGSRLTVKSTGATYVVKASAVSGYTTDSVAVIPTGGAYAVLQPRGGYYLASDFGTAGDGVTDDATRLQKAINFANGVDLFISDGRYLTSQTLIIKRALGATIRGAGNRRHGFTTGTQIKYTGSGDALTMTGVGTESLLQRFKVMDLTITGTASARHGINMDIVGGAVLGGVISHVTVDSFLSPGSFGLHLSKCYQLIVYGCRIVQNTSGIRLYNEAAQVQLNGNWITPADSIGVKIEYPTNRIYGGVIDNSSSQPTGQIGIVTTSSFVADGVLFEDLDKALDIRAGTDYFHATNLHMNATDIPSTIADSVNAIIENCYISQDIQAGLGSVWKGISGSAQILWPTISGNNADGISTITKVEGSPGSYTLSETGYPGLRAGETYTLIFQDDSVRINDEATGNVYFKLKNGQDFKGLTNDEITFVSQTNSDGTVALREISRHRSNPYRTHTASYTILSGLTGNVYANQGASGDITFTLPAENGERLSFVASAATHSIIIDPAGTDRFRGYSDAVTFTMKTGAFMTIASQSNGGVRYWDVEDAWGNIVITSNGKGLFQGLEYAVIADSVAMKFKTVLATTNYRINNNRSYQSYKSDLTTIANLLSLDATDNVILGQLDQNDLYLRAGSFSHATSGDDIFLDAGSSTRMKVASTGEVWIGSLVDQGTQTLQVTGDQYLSGNLTMGGVNLRAGSGSPEGVVTAVVGSGYWRTDGGASTTLYVKESGAGNTGWVAYGAASSSLLNYTAQSGTYNITASDDFIECTANSFTVNIITAVGRTGKVYTIKNTGTGTITLDPAGTETIDGATTKTLTVQYEAMSVLSNGANWLIK